MKGNGLLTGRAREELYYDYGMQQLVDEGLMTVKVVNGQRLFTLTKKGKDEAIKIVSNKGEK